MGGTNGKFPTQSCKKEPECRNRKFLLRGFKSGKSTMFFRLKFGKDCDNDFYLKYYEGGETFDFNGQTFTGWDVNGRQPEERLAQLEFDRCESVVFVIDSANEDGIYSITRCIDELKDYYYTSELLQNKVLMVLANKQDLEGAISAQEMEDRIKKECDIKFGITTFVMPTSAVTWEGVELAFNYFWTLMNLKRKKLLKPGLLSGLWKIAEKQMASNDFTEICIAKKEKKKNHFVHAVKQVLNY